MVKSTILALACCSLVVAGAVSLDAQSSNAAPPTQTQSNDGKSSPPSPMPGAAPSTTAPPRTSPQQRLEDASGVLTGVAEKSLPFRAQKAFAQLKKDFAALAASYKAHPEADDWTLIFSIVERDLSPLIGVGAAATPLQDRNMPDAATRLLLGSFRTNVELFYDAASTTTDSGNAAPPTTPGPA